MGKRKVSESRVGNKENQPREEKKQKKLWKERKPTLERGGDQGGKGEPQLRIKRPLSPMATPDRKKENSKRDGGGL